METIELITALEEGKLLEKDYAIAHPQSGYREEGECVQYLFKEDYKQEKLYNCVGWGSYNAEKTALQELFYFPHYWKISKHQVSDQPWSILK